MKKIIIVLIILCLGIPVFAQGMDLGLGFQYGTASVRSGSNTVREITEPGLLITFRLVPDTIGLFARAGLLFPFSVTEGDLELRRNDFDYILFLNAALGASFRTPISSHFSFLMDVGLSINNLFYQGSVRNTTIDARWEVKISNAGGTWSQTGGNTFTNVTINDNWNDMGMGLFGNAAMRFNFSQNVFLELGAAASFDFLRFKSYRLSADFRNARVNGIPGVTQSQIDQSFPGAMIEDNKVVFDKSGDFSIFTQFTFIPSLSIGFSF